MVQSSSIIVQERQTDNSRILSEDGKDWRRVEPQLEDSQGGYPRIEAIKLNSEEKKGMLKPSIE